MPGEEELVREKVKSVFDEMSSHGRMVSTVWNTPSNHD